MLNNYRIISKKIVILQLKRKEVIMDRKQVLCKKIEKYGSSLFVKFLTICLGIGIIAYPIIIFLGFTFKCDFIKSFNFLCHVEVLAVLLTAFGTIIAARMAIKAYYESIESRNSSWKSAKENSFGILINQLLDNHKDVFANRVLLTTPIVVKQRIATKHLFPPINSKNNVFKNFCCFYEGNQSRIKITGDLVKVWDDYNHLIRYNVEFSHCFKFVFYEINTVLQNDTITSCQKGRYLGIIQSYMNYDHLFCYLINLIQHFHRHSNDEDNYRTKLKIYKFFGNLREEPKYEAFLLYLKGTAVKDDLEELIELYY